MQELGATRELARKYRKDLENSKAEMGAIIMNLEQANSKLRQ
jgi:hypothetical protein